MATSLESEDDFLAAVRRHPADDDLRRAYADFLTARGGELDHARAELIAVQVEQVGTTCPGAAVRPRRYSVAGHVPPAGGRITYLCARRDCRHCDLGRRARRLLYGDRDRGADLWRPARDAPLYRLLPPAVRAVWAERPHQVGYFVYERGILSRADFRYDGHVDHLTGLRAVARAIPAGRVTLVETTETPAPDQLLWGFDQLWPWLAWGARPMRPHEADLWRPAVTGNGATG